MAYELIETVEVGAGGASSIEFTSIPQDGVDLLCVLSGRSSYGFRDDLVITINSNTSSVYSEIYLQGSGSSASSGSFSSQPAWYVLKGLTGNSATSNTFSSNAILFSNYTSSSNKSVSIDSVQEDNQATAYQSIFAGVIADTSPVTSLKLAPSNGTTLLQYSTASLYKIS